MCSSWCIYNQFYLVWSQSEIEEEDEEEEENEGEESQISSRSPTPQRFEGDANNSGNCWIYSWGPLSFIDICNSNPQRFKGMPNANNWGNGEYFK